MIYPNGRILHYSYDAPAPAPGSGTPVSLDRYQYAYDRDGNVTAKNNLLFGSLNETYTYDNLNRLTGSTRGGAAYQAWNLDALGNAGSVTTQGVPQTNAFNSQNQLTTAGAATLAFDANGNTIIDDQGHKLLYDAWNRLVKVTDATGATVLAAYTYDADGRRVSETNSAGVTTNLYYSSRWQVLEERRNGTAWFNVSQQYVWSATYVDALLLRDRYAGGVMIAGGRLYAQHDANYNVTALINTSGQVVERYVYDPYGKVTVLNADATVRGDGTIASSTYGWRYLHQGGRFDTATGLYSFRRRDYSPTLQRWLEQDPAGYRDSNNLYLYVIANPIKSIDPLGLSQDLPYAPGWFGYVPFVGWGYGLGYQIANTAYKGMQAFEGVDKADKSRKQTFNNASNPNAPAPSTAGEGLKEGIDNVRDYAKEAANTPGTGMAGPAGLPKERPDMIEKTLETPLQIWTDNTGFEKKSTTQPANPPSAHPPCPNSH